MSAKSKRARARIRQLEVTLAAQVKEAYRQQRRARLAEGDRQRLSVLAQSLEAQLEKFFLVMPSENRETYELRWRISRMEIEYARNDALRAEIIAYCVQKACYEILEKAST